MTPLLRALRRTGFSDEQASRLRGRLEGFLKGADLAESALIIDGPGPGLATHFVALSLLGPTRVSEFRSIHSVSASAFGVLYFVARHRGMLTLTPALAENFNRANQARHGLGGWGTAARLLLRKLSGSPYLFPNDRAAEVLAYGLHPGLLRMTVAALPENLSFWTYCVEERRPCEIRRDGDFAHWSVEEVIRAVTAVAGIYAPLVKAGKTYADAVTTPQLREVYRDLRSRHRHVLFLHMSRDGTRGNTTFVKLHDGGSGRLRLMLDFLYFMSGAENRDVDDAIGVGLRVAPI